MPSSLLSGPQYLLAGLQLMLRPGLRLFVLIPVLINLLVFAGLFYLLVMQFEQLLIALMPSLPEWLRWMEYLLWPLFVALLMVMLFFSFTLVASLLAAPFNGLLSEKVERLVRGGVTAPSFHWSELLAIAPRTFQREWQKLSYFLPRALGLLVLSFIPVLNLVAAPLWLLFGIWMMAVQYLDYPADNQGVSWEAMLRWLRQRRWRGLGFGGATYAALLVPGLNLLVMPAAVVGATLFWIEEHPAP